MVTLPTAFLALLQTSLTAYTLQSVMAASLFCQPTVHPLCSLHPLFCDPLLCPIVSSNPPPSSMSSPSSWSCCPFLAHSRTCLQAIRWGTFADIGGLLQACMLVLKYPKKISKDMLIYRNHRAIFMIVQSSTEDEIYFSSSLNKSREWQ